MIYGEHSLKIKSMILSRRKKKKLYQLFRSSGYNFSFRKISYALDLIVFKIKEEQRLKGVQLTYSKILYCLQDILEENSFSSQLKEEILKIIKSSDPNTELISGSKELLKQLYFQKNATLVTLSNSTLTSGSNTLSTLNLSNTIIGKNNS